MDGIKKFGRWFAANISTVASFIGWLVSVGFFPALLAYSRGASPLEYGIAAVAGLLAAALIRYLWMAARNLRANARIKERLTSDSSPFDPMARVYENKRLFLRDLAPSGRRFVEGRKFVNCEIIGPGSIAIGTRSADSKPWPDFRDNTFYDVDCIEADPDVVSNTAVFFPDCDFDGCSFFHMNLLFFQRLPTAWHWITPDYSQPPLALEDGKDGKEAEDAKSAE